MTHNAADCSEQRQSKCKTGGQAAQGGGPHGVSLPVSADGGNEQRETVHAAAQLHSCTAAAADHERRVTGTKSMKNEQGELC